MLFGKWCYSGNTESWGFSERKRRMTESKHLLFLGDHSFLSLGAARRRASQLLMDVDTSRQSH